MDVSHALHDIKFEWNSRKASTNLRKHGVSFETACEAFFDPFFRVEDAGIIEGESREALIGMTVNWRLLYVIYLMQEADAVRIISARPATEMERKRYEDQ